MTAVCEFTVSNVYLGLCVYETSSTHVVKARSYSIRFVLQEVTSDGFVAYVTRLGGVGADRSRFGRYEEKSRGRDEC